MDLNTAASFANSAIKNLQLNEWQSRQLLGAIAVVTNARGAISLLNRETGFSRNTIGRGIEEVKQSGWNLENKNSTITKCLHNVENKIPKKKLNGYPCEYRYSNFYNELGDIVKDYLFFDIDGNICSYLSLSEIQEKLLDKGIDIHCSTITSKLKNINIKTSRSKKAYAKFDPIDTFLDVREINFKSSSILVCGDKKEDYESTSFAEPTCYVESTVEVTTEENESSVEIINDDLDDHRDINSYYPQVTLMFLKIIISFYVEFFPNTLKIVSPFETTVDRFYSIFVPFQELNFAPFDDKVDCFLSLDYFAELTDEEQSYLEMLIKLFEPKINKRKIKRKQWKNGKCTVVRKREESTYYKVKDEYPFIAIILYPLTGVR